MRRLRFSTTLALAALALACAGAPESEFEWDEEVIEGPEAAPRPSSRRDAPRDRNDREAEELRESSRARRGEGERGEAIYSPREGTSCDERVATCYTAKGAHVGLSEEQFGREAGRRLERRLDAGRGGAEAVARVDGGVCDRLSKVCYERAEPDVDLTRVEFGRAAASDLAARLGARRSRPGAGGEAIYSPRRGVACDELVAACYVDEEVHLGHTREQFGRDAAVSLERRVDHGPKARDGVYRPAGGAVCDRLSQVCYDRFGASASLTRAEFGRAAAARAAERLR